MTTSKFFAQLAVLDLLGMYLGMWENSRLLEEGKEEEAYEKNSWIKERLAKLESSLSLSSIKSYLHVDPREWVEELKGLVGRLKSNDLSLAEADNIISPRLEEISPYLGPCPRF